MAKYVFKKGERRKNQNWRAFTVITGNITRAGVLVRFDDDPLTGNSGNLCFQDAQWVHEADILKD